MALESSKTMRCAAILVLLCVSVENSFCRASGSQEAYSRAEAFVRHGEWNEGLALLVPLLKAEPENLKALNLMGIALTGKGDLKKANQQFEQALRINPRFLPALNNLAINEF